MKTKLTYYSEVVYILKNILILLEEIKELLDKGQNKNHTTNYEHKDNNLWTSPKLTDWDDIDEMFKGYYDLRKEGEILKKEISETLGKDEGDKNALI